jgi:predicted negative regulator of RcsB-dependent stress response
MFTRLAQMTGVPTIAIKIAFFGLLILILLIGYRMWKADVINDYESDVQANVAVVTDTATAKADAQAHDTTETFTAKQAQSRKEIDDAKHDNRSPLNALFQ